MTTTNPDLGLIKVDCIGRVRTTPEHRKALVAAFDDSALSGPEFCSHHGIKYQTFATWLQKHRRATGAYASDSSATVATFVGRGGDPGWQSRRHPG